MRDRGKWWEREGCEVKGGGRRKCWGRKRGGSDGRGRGKWWEEI